MNRNGRIVSVLNMKGGVGKTTITAHVMRVLYHRKQQKTLLVDLDPQFNLTQAVVVRSTYDKLKDDGHTVYKVMEPAATVGLFDVSPARTPPPKVADVIHPLRNFLKKEITLDLLPGDFRLVKYSMIADQDKLKSVQQRFLRFISDARKEYDLICIDCNPSSSFITTCALFACTDLLVPVRPDRYSVLGLELLSDLMEQMPNLHPKPEIHVLLNGIPRRNYSRDIELQLRSHPVFGPRVLGNVVPESGLLAAKGDYTGFATDRPVPWKDLLKTEISSVVDELALRLGIKG